MPFQRAGAAEVLRAAQKDESFLNHLKTCLSEIVQRSFGTRTWLDIHKYVEVVCELVYYSLTTLSLHQTLGEEYTGILQVSRSRQRLPNVYERVIMVALQCFGPEIIRRLMMKLENSLRSGNLSVYFRPEIKNFLLLHMPAVRYSMTLLHRIHLAVFYFSGAFYHLSKRVTGIKYVLVREWLGDSTARKSFQILSMVLLTHIFLTTVYSAYTTFFTKASSESKQTVGNCYVESKDQCSLCLDKRQHSSITPCGHLFCWQCIHESLQTSQQCPLCRHPAKPSQIVALLNYD